MFDNIVANNEINFNDLEKKIYKFVYISQSYVTLYLKIYTLEYQKL